MQFFSSWLDLFKLVNILYVVDYWLLASSTISRSKNNLNQISIQFQFNSIRFLLFDFFLNNCSIQLIFSSLSFCFFYFLLCSSSVIFFSFGFYYYVFCNFIIIIITMRAISIKIDHCQSMIRVFLHIYSFIKFRKKNFIEIILNCKFFLHFPIIFNTFFLN